ncbi:MAG: dienelactone hydrolase family protein [Kangiellaceae bacterium]|nr:dienelactone hydrolase family protein [Kangiellaceae bacterium]
MKKSILLLAHGAGADSNSEFMQHFKQSVANDAIEVKTFDFPYMLRRQQTGKKSPPDRMPKLIEAFKQQIEQVPVGTPLFIGGKSMGGRVASLIADEVGVAGLICLGYPFHPPGKPENTRTEHLTNLHTPSLIIQGTRDTFGKPAEVKNYELSKNIEVQWIEDGNHSLETLKRSAMTTEQSWSYACQLMQQFIVKNSK